MEDLNQLRPEQESGAKKPAPDDVDALTKALREMASNPEQRIRWGENSLRRGRLYSVEARCAELESIYHSVL